jgi:hypothetical protein
MFKLFNEKQNHACNFVSIGKAALLLDCFGIICPKRWALAT